MVVRTKWNDLQLVTAQKNSEIRQKGGIKSSIVAKVKKGDTLYLQEELDNWSRVATADGYSGYIKKEVLSDPKDDNEEHASTVPEYTNISKDYKINLAFHQVTSMDGNATSIASQSLFFTYRVLIPNSSISRNRSMDPP